MNRSNMIFTKLSVLTLSLFAIALLATSTSQATPIYDTFGPLDGATFGGTGIPTTEVAISDQFADGNDILITVAMSATQRYSNPVVTNDGAGTYFATTGSNFGGSGQSASEGALWNFNYYINIEGFNGATPLLTDYQITIFYDFDSGEDTAIGSLGTIDVTNFINLFGNPLATTKVEDSQNLLFGSLSAAAPGLIAPPAGSFDPNATGEYSFGIQVTRAGWSVETVAMDVQVVPEPTAIALATLGLFAFGTRRRRKA